MRRLVNADREQNSTQGALLPARGIPHRKTCIFLYILQL
jgi:hypothetical protein